MGVESTGSGRRQSFRVMPQPRMCNTYMPSGDVDARGDHRLDRARALRDVVQRRPSRDQQGRLRVHARRRLPDRERQDHRAGARRDAGRQRPRRDDQGDDGRQRRAAREPLATRAARADSTCRSASAFRPSSLRRAPSEEPAVADPRDEALALAEAALAQIVAAGASDADATVTIADRFACRGARPRADQARALARPQLARARVRRHAARDALDHRSHFRAASRRWRRASSRRPRSSAKIRTPDCPSPAAPGERVRPRSRHRRARRRRARPTRRRSRRRSRSSARCARPTCGSRTPTARGSATRIASWALANTRGFRGVTAGHAGRAQQRAGRARRRRQADRPLRHAPRAAGPTLEPAQSVALHAVHRALALLGARKPATMRVPVIFERDVAAAVLEDVFAALNAANVAVGNSWLADRLATGRQRARSRSSTTACCAAAWARRRSTPRARRRARRSALRARRARDVS